MCGRGVAGSVSVDTHFVYGSALFGLLSTPNECILRGIERPRQGATLGPPGPFEIIVFRSKMLFSMPPSFLGSRFGWAGWV